MRCGRTDLLIATRAAICLGRRCTSHAADDPIAIRKFLYLAGQPSAGSAYLGTIFLPATVVSAHGYA